MLRLISLVLLSTLLTACGSDTTTTTTSTDQWVLDSTKRTAYVHQDPTLSATGKTLQLTINCGVDTNELSVTFDNNLSTGEGTERSVFISGVEFKMHVLNDMAYVAGDIRYVTSHLVQEYLSGNTLLISTTRDDGGVEMASFATSGLLTAYAECNLG